MALKDNKTISVGRVLHLRHIPGKTLEFLENLRNISIKLSGTKTHSGKTLEIFKLLTFIVFMSS